MDDDRAWVLHLDDEDAAVVERSGGKAAALATAAAAGLPVLPGVVVTTAAVGEIDRSGDVARIANDLEPAFKQLTDEGERAVVVRSSSPLEDRSDESMAGRFESVVGVRDWPALLDAVRKVLASRERAGGADQPIAVLVQPEVEPEASGVLFGVDPVTGRSDRMVVAAVRGQPDALVSGEAAATHHVLDADGALLRVEEGEDGITLARGQLHELALLAARVAFVFGGPQDVEWAITDGRLLLLQSRPVTTEVAGEPVGPILGPGPVAETFPDPLSPLEEDLWVVPLRHALREALDLAGTADPKAVAASPLTVSVGGRVAVDLELLGDAGRRRRFDLRRIGRRVRAAWRVGRLRGALAGLAEDLVDRADAALTAVPPFAELNDRQLVGVLRRARAALVSVHAHEVLVGLLVDPDAPRLTGTSVALRVLTEARRAGCDDATIVAEHPVVLALTPPRVGGGPRLPEGSAPPSDVAGGEDRMGLLREALRLRVRWLQELGARAAAELGRRLEREGLLEHADDVRYLTLDALDKTVRGRAVVWRRGLPPPEPPPPLPARFRCSSRGGVIPLREGGEGTGAGGGRGRGRVAHDPERCEPGDVLVVRTLDPGLAPVLPRLGGLVAETGSVLAHVAILAREQGVPTVVGLAGAREHHPEGSVVTVDGTSGEVEAS